MHIVYATAFFATNKSNNSLRLYNKYYCKTLKINSTGYSPPETIIKSLRRFS